MPYTDKALGKLTEEDEQFLKRLKDLERLAEKTYSAKFTSFLTERELKLAEFAVPDASFYGGYENASRKMLAIGECKIEDFPLFAITARFREADELTHRDFLGSLMSFGVKRELIGDILTGKGFAVFFVTSTVKQLVFDSMTKVGRVGVKLSEGIGCELPAAEFEEIDGVVASMRLDSVTAAITHLSREKSVKMIKGGLVVLSGNETDNINAEVLENNTIAIRGYGKFVVSEIGRQTQKGKLHIKIKKYK